MQPLRATPLFVAPVAGVVLAARPVGAQSAPGTPERARPIVTPGTVVRVRGRDLVIGPGPATVVEARDDTLLLRERDGALAFVPLDQVTAIEVAAGKRSRGEGARRGARTGALLVGIPTAVATGVALVSDLGRSHSGCSDVCVPATPLIAAGGAVLTGVALVGAAVGAGTPPGVRWVRAPLPMRVSVVPTARGGTVLALGVRF